jgi:hypothetical protein
MFVGAPFGLKHLTALMQRLMDAVFVDCWEFVIIIVDGIIIFSLTLKDHIRDVTQVLEALTWWNLKVNVKKCHWCCLELAALGHRLGIHGQSADPLKIERVFTWVRPTSGKEIMAFLGFTNFIRDYVVHYASLAAPLDSLRHVTAISQAEWTVERVQAFEALKCAFKNASQLLQDPVQGQTLEVACDASQYGLGAVLFQKVAGQFRYIEFASQSLNQAQRNYSATRRELLAVVFALNKFRYYVASAKFRLLTDHRALVYLLTQEHVNPMLSTWLETVLEFNFTIEHIAGVLNVLPDALSRQYPAFLKERAPLVLSLKKDPVSPVAYSICVTSTPRVPALLGGGVTILLFVSG